MSDKIRFMFLRDTKSRPIGCIAMMVNTGGTIQYGLSVLNPVDTFNRKTARKLAAGSMLLDSGHAHVENVRTVYTMHDVSIAVMNAIAHFDGYPARARKAAKHWLNTKMRDPKEAK
jgi:butyrate kinase